MGAAAPPLNPSVKIKERRSSSHYRRRDNAPSGFKVPRYFCVPTSLLITGPLQVGVIVKGGCETIIHATSHLMSSSPADQHWTLLLDFSNVFNSISRESMFVELHRRLPGLSAWMESCYSCQPLLHHSAKSDVYARVYQVYFCVIHCYTCA